MIGLFTLDMNDKGKTSLPKNATIKRRYERRGGQKQHWFSEIQKEILGSGTVKKYTKKVSDEAVKRTYCPLQKS